jgi:tetratricopeptide (TPR) repeat protein
MKKYFVLVILILISFKVSFCQDSLKILQKDFMIKGKSDFDNAWMKLEKANLLYDLTIYDDAIIYYETANRYNPNNVVLNYRLGVCYMKKFRIYKSLEYLKKAYQINPNLTPEFEYIMGRLFQLNYEFDEAITHFKKYFKNSKTPEIGLDRYKFIKECLYAKEAIKNPVNVTVLNVGDNINSINEEYMPIYIGNDSILFFTKTTIGLPRKEGIYYSKLNGSIWSKLQIFDSIILDKKFSNYGLSYISKDMTYMLIVGCGDKKYPGSCNLYYLNKEKTEWTEPIIIDGINSNNKITYSTINESRDTIYFTMVEKNGSADIYYATADRKNNKWNVPIKLNSEINTKFDEYVLFLSKNTLYFASNGLNGFGGFDIYKTTLYNDSWTIPVNLGYPINTPYDEFGFSLSKDVIYISSNRDGTYGLKDIFKIVYKK